MTDQLVSQDTGTVTAFGYDAFGNMTAKAEGTSTQTTYSYDPANRLTRIAPAAGAMADFTFDALGRFATRTLDTTPYPTTDTYAYLGSGEVVHELSTLVNTTTTATRSLLDASGSRLGLKVGAGSAAWALFDPLGSLVALEDGAAARASHTKRWLREHPEPSQPTL